MSTTAPPGNSSQYVDFDEYVEFQLEKTRTTIRWTDLVTAGAAVLAGFLGYLFIFVVLDQWVIPGGFGRFSRTVLLLLWLAGTGAWLFAKLIRPWLRRVNRLYAARELERAEPGLHSSLLNLIDLRDAGRTVNPAVLKSLQRKAAVRLSEMDVNEAIDHRSLLRASYALLIVVVSLCLYALLSPKKITTSLWRVLPTSTVAAATRTEIFSLAPGNTTTTAELPLEVTVELRGQLPPEAKVLYTTADEKYLDQPVVLRPEQEGSARYIGAIWGENGKGVLQDFTYRVEAGDAVSETYQVKVEPPPSATIETLRLEFPTYMQLEPQVQTGGNIDAWEGATVSLRAATNREIESAKIEFRDQPNGGPNGIEIPLHVIEGRQLRGEWPLALPASGEAVSYYCIRCLTHDGQTEKDPAVYTIKIRPDQAPEVVLLQPERDLEAPANAVIPMIVQARDPDFLLGPIRLQLEKAGEVIHVKPLSSGGRRQTILRNELNLEPLGLMPGDTVAFWVEATDNRQPRPNRKNTPKLKINISKPVSDEDVQQLLAEQKKKQAEQLAEAAANQNREERDDSPQLASEDDPNSLGVNSPEPGQGRPRTEPPQDPDSQRPPAGGDTPPGDEPQRDKPEENGTAKPSPAGGAGETSEDRQPLNPMGGDDDEILKLLNEELNKEPREEQPRNGNEPQNSPEEKKPSPKKGDSDGSGGAKGGGDDAQPGNQPMPGQEKRAGAGERGDERSGEPTESEKGAGGQKSPDRNGTDRPADGAPPQTGKPGSEKNSPATGPNQRPEPGAGNTPNDKRGDGSEKNADSSPNGGKPDQPANQPGNRPGDKEEMPPGGKPSDKPENQSGKPGKNKSPTDIPNGEQPGQNGDKPGDKAGQDGMKTGKGSAGEKTDTAADSGDEPSKTAKGSDSSADGDKQPGGKGEATDKPAPGKQPGTPQDKPGQGAGGEPMPADGEGDPSGAKSAEGTTDQTGRKPSGDSAGKEPSGREPKPGRNGDSQEMRPKAAEKSQDPAGAGAGAESAQEPGRAGSPSSKEDSGARGSSSKPGSRQNGKTEQQTGTGKPEGESRPTKPGEKGSPKPVEGKAAGNEPAENGKPGTNSKPGGAGKPQGETSGNDGGKPEGAPMPGGDPKGADGKGEGPAGDKPASDQPGGDQAGDKPAGADQKGGGQEAGGDKSGAGKESGGQEGASDGAGKPGSQPGTKGGQSPVGGNPISGGQGGTGASGPSSGNEVEAGDAPDPEYNRQAAELVLRKLQDDLERGDVNPDLLEKLGWNEEQLRVWSDRLAKQLQKAPAETPIDRARQIQFEEMLRQLNLRQRNNARSGADQPIRELSQRDSRRSEPPAEYRERVEAFTRSLSKRQGTTSKPPQK